MEFLEHGKCGILCLRRPVIIIKAFLCLVFTPLSGFRVISFACLAIFIPLLFLWVFLVVFFYHRIQIFIFLLFNSEFYLVKIKCPHEINDRHNNQAISESGKFSKFKSTDLSIELRDWFSFYEAIAAGGYNFGNSQIIWYKFNNNELNEEFPMLYESFNTTKVIIEASNYSVQLLIWVLIDNIREI